ncbi:MAG: hypothetical protein ACK4NW_02000 [Roseinatronobacter sp.]
MTQLNRLVGTRSAAQDGVLMINADGEVVVSRDGLWVPLQAAELVSPDNTRWRLAVDNAGVLSAVAV